MCYALEGGSFFGTEKSITVAQKQELFLITACLFTGLLIIM
jgi:hypothetical protein